MDSRKIQNTLLQQVPESAVNYCVLLWQELPFEFKLRKNRLSKVGDFTSRIGHRPRITLNFNLHPYVFLMTYVHEVAHHRVHQAKGFRAEAHGDEWKSTFQELMAPLLKIDIFPEPLLAGLKKHMAAPKASSYSDSTLTQLFRSLDERERTAVLLSHIPEGSTFSLHGKWFTKGKVRRTRVLCRELKSKRQYLVPVDAPIGNAQLALL